MVPGTGAPSAEQLGWGVDARTEIGTAVIGEALAAAALQHREVLVGR